MTVFRDARKRARLAVVLEVQRKIDWDKRRTWPAYVATARARFNCPTIGLGQARNRREAKAAMPMSLLGR